MKAIKALLLVSVMGLSFSNPAYSDDFYGPTGKYDEVNNVYTIRNSPGGYVRAFKYRMELASRKDTLVRIGGICASACTIFLGARNVCVEKDAQLMFHAPYYFKAFGQKVVLENEPLLLELYPRSIRNWIADNGGLLENWIVLRGDALARLVPTCNVSVTYN